MTSLCGKILSHRPRRRYPSKEKEDSNQPWNDFCHLVYPRVFICKLREKSLLRPNKIGLSQVSLYIFQLSLPRNFKSPQSGQPLRYSLPYSLPDDGAPVRVPTPVRFHFAYGFDTRTLAKPWHSAKSDSEELPRLTCLMCMISSVNTSSFRPARIIPFDNYRFISSFLSISWRHLSTIEFLYAVMFERSFVCKDRTGKTVIVAKKKYDELGEKRMKWKVPRWEGMFSFSYICRVALSKNTDSKGR